MAVQLANDVIEIPSDPTTDAGALSLYTHLFHKYDSRFSISSNRILFKGAFAFSFINNSNSLLGIGVNAGTTSTSTFYTYNTQLIRGESYKVLIVIMDGMWYCAFKTNDDSMTDAGNILIIKNDTKYYFGSTTSASTSINADTFVRPEIQSTDCTLQVYANFALISPNIIYSNTSLFTEGSTSYDTVRFLKSSSTVASNRIFVIDGTPYLSIGNHSLIKLEEYEWL